MTNASGLDPAGLTDTDNDGVINYIDNCPEIANSEQTDTDGDTEGDACDDDDDNDGIDDALEPGRVGCPPVCYDADGDGCDDCSTGTDGFGPLADNESGQRRRRS